MTVQRPTLWLSLCVMLALCACNGTPAGLQGRIEANHWLYRPAGDGPFPAVVAIPGCSGVSLGGPATDTGREGDEADPLFRRHYPRMAERLSEKGYAVFLIDYLSAHGVSNACNGEISFAEVGQYVLASAAFARSHPFVDASEISVIGWSLGGGGVLASLASLSEEAPPPFNAAIAFYPGCEGISPWSIPIPTLLLLGGLDDIAPPEVCVDLVERAGEGLPVELRTYPEGRHGFDVEEAPELLAIGGDRTIGFYPAAANIGDSLRGYRYCLR